MKLANAYAKSKNYVDLAFQAHALKSSSKSVGAIELANICQQIETQAESEIVKADYIQQLEECFNDVVTQLKSYCLRYEKRT
ncbi:Hpt domain-containing protein [Pseudoalteromonas sp. B193]